MSIGTPEFQVTARLNSNGEASAKVTASCAYDGDRNAYVHEDITDEKTLAEIGKVLKKTIVDVRESLGKQATADACRSYAVAADRGEL